MATLRAEGHSDFTNTGFGQLEISETAAETASCESILRWPIFQGIGSTERIKSLPLQADTDREVLSPFAATTPPGLSDSARQRSISRVGLQTDNILALCRKFQALVLVKNPFMAKADFARYAAEVSENGPGWDSPSCLVLLACALACLVKPYSSASTDGHDEDEDSFQQIPLANYVDENAAESFYSAALKRIGLVGNSLIASQCYYYAGLFEKFSIRPLQAWPLFQQGCIQFQIGIWRRAHSVAGIEDSETQSARHFEQRLYWSCVKAEAELRAEMQFPSSGLLKFKYPQQFPYLSMPTPGDQADTSPQSGADDSLDLGDSSTRLEAEDEQSWLHYLAEISLRGVMNRIQDAFYSRGEDFWAQNIMTVIKNYSTSHEDLLLWRSHLPPRISFDDGSIPEDELTFFLKCRYYFCQEWIHRPFLYYAVCQPADDPHRPQVLRLAQKCLHYATNIITLSAHKHRYGGCWFNMRRSFGCALIILASVGIEGLYPPEDWKDLVTVSLQSLSYWEAKAADLRWSRQILRKVFQHVCHSTES